MVFRLVLLGGLSIAAGLNAPLLSHEVRHLINEDDDFCPYAYAEERLLYNIAIEVEGALEGCGDDDLLKIGTILQQIVDEVEAEIPEYDNEDMQTTICKVPVLELARRGLRLAKSNRELANAGRYRYRGGGKCRRCRRNNNGRHLFQEAVNYETTCFNTDMAIYDADLAHLSDVTETAVQAVEDALLYLKESALECSNLRVGKTLVTWAKETLEECKAAQQEALYAVERARAQCQQAKLATSEAQQQPLIRQAAEAFDTAMNAADKVQKLYSEMQDKLETTDVCNLPVETTGDDLNVEGASSMAEMATFGAEMSATAVMKAKEVFLQLEDRVMECGDSMAGTQSIESARAQLLASQKAKKQAARKARISRSQAQQARAATTQEELIHRAKMAEKSSTLAYIAAERARYSYFLIRDELERTICGETEVPPEDETTPLKQWLVKLMNMLYDRIPERISNVFRDSETCSLGGTTIYIHIDALELPWEKKWLITKEDCDNLREIPGQ